MDFKKMQPGDIVLKKELNPIPMTLSTIFPKDGIIEYRCSWFDIVDDEFTDYKNSSFEKHEIMHVDDYYTWEKYFTRKEKINKIVN